MFRRGECIRAYRPDRVMSGSVFVVEDETPMKKEGAEQKVRVELTLLDSMGRPRREKLPGVVKRVSVLGEQNGLYCFQNDVSYAEAYYQSWQILRRAGLPTLPVMRVIDEERVIMPDMTADGSMFFGKGKKNIVVDGREPYLAELVFMSLDLEKLLERAAWVEGTAWEKGIVLPFDDPLDLLVHPDGSWEVMVVDLGWLERKTELGDKCPFLATRYMEYIWRKIRYRYEHCVLF